MEFEIHKLILNAKQPCVLRKCNVPWKLFEISFEEWCKLYDTSLKEKKLDFEEASFFHDDSPQWERYRKNQQMQLHGFLNFQKKENNPKSWLTFSYKNLQLMPQCCRENIDFKFCGFSDAEDISYWLSSKGAHTPCHYDTYGCNVVVQVYGRKMWLLFPPNAKLTPVRVPYEESSVYSSEAFYSPKEPAQLKHIEETCYKCILEPGDVLIVPNKWWHYVESLTSSLSINTWIPLEIDNDARVEECIVRHIVNRLTFSSDKSELMHLLNPNEFGQFEEEEESLCLLNYLLQIAENTESVSTGLKAYNYQNLNEAEVHSIAKNLKAEWITSLSTNDFRELVVQQSTRYKPEEDQSKNIVKLKMKQALINSICNPELIAKVKELLLLYSNK